MAKKAAKADPSNADILAFLKTRLDKIDGRMNDVEKRLQTLGSLEKKVDGFGQELKKLWTTMEDRNKRLGQRVQGVEDRTESADFNVTQLTGRVTELEKQRVQLSDEVVYVTSQSMRNNLIFTNILEDDDEVPAATEDKLRKHLVDKLKIARDLVDNMGFERVHRIGEKRAGRVRNVVANFV